LGVGRSRSHDDCLMECSRDQWAWIAHPIAVRNCYCGRDSDDDEGSVNIVSVQEIRSFLRCALNRRVGEHSVTRQLVAHHSSLVPP